jgi:YD repeat-containing protein
LPFTLGTAIVAHRGHCRLFSLTHVAYESASWPSAALVAAYNADNTLQRKHDAKGQDTVYTYDSLKRVIEIQRYPSGLNNAEDVCGRVTYAWGTDPSAHDYGRLDDMQYYAPSYGRTNGCGWVNTYLGGTTDQ